MNKLIMTVVAGGLALGAFAAGGEGRDNFLVQQAVAQAQRISGQVDVLQRNYDDLAERVARLERASGAKGETEALRAEIASLRSQVAQLKRDLEKQREDIVRRVSTLIAEQMKEKTPPPSKTIPKPVYTGSYKEFKIEPGDTLSSIAQAAETTVAKICELNNIKKDTPLRVGQVLKIPCK